MNIEEIRELWIKDKHIDQTDLGGEILRMARLHDKYYNILYDENIVLRYLDKKMALLKKEKFEFYLDGHNEETVAKGWKYPPKGKLARMDIPMYVDADPDYIELSLKIGIQKEKVDYIKNNIMEIIKTLQYTIRTALEDMKFKNGL